jgi:hypothetical protein
MFTDEMSFTLSRETYWLELLPAAFTIDRQQPRGNKKSLALSFTPPQQNT